MSITSTPIVSDFTPPFLEDEQSEAGKRVSEETYWQHYYNHPDFNYEWNDGILEVKPMADFSKSQMYLWFVYLLKHYLEVHPIAHIIALEIGFKLNLLHKTTIRKPDLALFLGTNRVQMALSDRTYWGVFDLCIEFVSDSSRAETERDTVTKKNEYQAVGVQEYYILDDQNRYTTFYERTANGLYQPIQARTGGVITSQVLTGFQFRMKDLYQQPSWQALVDDPVYQGFIRPEYQAEKKRADQAEQRFHREREQLYQVEKTLMQERQRADQAEQYLHQEQQRADQVAATAKATTLTLLRQSLAHRFNLPLDYYDDTLSTLDFSTLTALSEQVFTVADQTAFEALLVR